MSYGGFPYGGVGYAASDVAEIPQADTQTALSVEVAFTTGALETPAWEDITADVRFWDVSRGRSRELEPFQPGRATIVLANLSRQYDAVYAAGPHFGDLRPMRRIRIRETFNGVTYPVFDGFVDRWQLDYPEVGKDATATLTATDAVKVFVRTELGRSVYTNEVKSHAPSRWWRLDDTLPIGDEAATALDSGSAGVNATYLNETKIGGFGLVVKDPGSSLELDAASNINSGVDAGTSLNVLSRIEANDNITMEIWCRPDSPHGANVTRMIWEQQASSPAISRMRLRWETSASSTGHFVLLLGGLTITGANNSAPGDTRYHVAVVVDSKATTLYVDGASYGSPSGSVGTLNTGTIGPLRYGNPSVGTGDQYGGFLQEAVIYLSALSSTDIAALNTAGRTPWQGDGPDDRLGRILDLAEWPSTLREIDAGAVTLQSAEILAQTVWDHAQKVADTEFGLLFISRDGKVRFVDRASQAARSPGPTVYGDGAGEVGYRSIRPDDGDEVIRNSATISRYNGVAQTATGATIDEFGRFQYTLDGLLHDSDSYSSSYAQFIVDEYEEPRRRIVELTIGPPKDGQEDLVYPAMLGPELGDAITVTHTPQGLGSAFTQTCIVEGIMHQSAPGRNRTTTFVLSPEFTQTLF